MEKQEVKQKKSNEEYEGKAYKPRRIYKESHDLESERKIFFAWFQNTENTLGKSKKSMC